MSKCGLAELAGLAMAICSPCKVALCGKCAFESRAEELDALENEGEEKEKEAANPKPRSTSSGWAKDVEKELECKADETAKRLGRRIRDAQLKCLKGHEMRASPVYAHRPERVCTGCGRGLAELVGMAMAICSPCKVALCIKCALESRAEDGVSTENEGEEQEKEAVRKLLEKAELTEFTERILNEGYDVETLANITKQGLEEVGMKGGHHQKLKEALDEAKRAV